MLKLRRLLAGTLGLVALFFAVRLLMPYEMPDSQVLIPSLYEARFVAATDANRQKILQQNIWLKERTSLVVPAEQAQKPALEDATAKKGPEADAKAPPVRLVGISTGEGATLAVVKFQEELLKFEPGDRLPDGSKLAEIHKLHIKKSKEGEDELVFLFQQD